jgi:hypothetical protein
MAIGILALVGTRKGLFLLRGDDERCDWQSEGPLLEGWGVYHAMLDARDGTVYAAATMSSTVRPSSARRTAGGPGGGRRRSSCPKGRS